MIGAITGRIFVGIELNQGLALPGKRIEQKDRSFLDGAEINAFGHGFESFDL